MTMPGWTAESSLSRTAGAYQMTTGMAATDGVIRPQACDYKCLAEWILACSDLTGQRYAQCVRAGRRVCC